MPAIPFISVDEASGRFMVNDAAADFLERLDAPLAVVAVAGTYRSGKSSILNRVLLDAAPGAGFSVGGTVQACTKGLWLSTDVLGVPQPDGSTMSVLVVDTEGLGAFNATETHDSRIFALALLVSSFFIYNSVGTIDEQAISTLSLVANISKHVKVKSDDAPPDDRMDENNDDNHQHIEQQAEHQNLRAAKELGQFFPDFLWLVRDFSLRLVDDDGDPISESQYLEQALRDKPGGDASAEKNRLRALLRAYFPRRQCATLVRPCANEADLQRVDTMDSASLRPEFLAAARRVRALILKRALPKTAAGSRPLSGRGLLRLCRAYVDALNRGAAPVIRDSWALLAEVQFRDAVDAADAAFRHAVNAFGGAGPSDAAALRAHLEQVARDARAVFDRDAPEQSGPVYEQFERKLSATLDALTRDVLETNRRNTAALARELLERHVDDGAGDDASWPEFVRQRYEPARAEFERRVGRGGDASATWAVAALPRIMWTAERLCARVDALRDEAQRLRAAAEQSDALRTELRAADAALQQAQTQALDAEVQFDVRRRALEEQLEQLAQEAAARDSDASCLNGEQRAAMERDWAEREAALKQRADVDVQEARAAADRLRNELRALQQKADASSGEFQQQLATLRADTQRALSEMRAANEQQEAALEQRADDAERARRAAEQQLAQLSERAALAEKRVDDERARHQTAEQHVQQQWRAEAKAQHDERLALLRACKEAEARLALRDQQLDTLKKQLAEEKPNVEAERASAALGQVEAESKRLRTELFEVRRALDDERVAKRTLERRLADQERDFEVDKMRLKMDFELELARRRAATANSSSSSSSSGAAPLSASMSTTSYASVDAAASKRARPTNNMFSSDANASGAKRLRTDLDGL